MTDGFGSITWWGFSPCLDIQEKGMNKALRQLSLNSNQDSALNILLIGAGDCRHILKTLSQRYKHSQKQFNFYVVESQMELYARDLLCMAIALEQQENMGIQEKTELFLELYGNLLVRKQSMEYVEKMSTDFIKMVTDFDYLEQRMPFIDLSLLKFKERDMLEAIFKFWRNTTPDIFQAEKCWDLRLRKYLGVRYDAIPNIFDWDFHMKLAEKGAGIINNRYYSNWRRKGNAFEIRDGTYDTPNKTLASGLVLKVDGEAHHRRGYWGDMIVSPYITFGIESDNQELFKKANHNYMKCSEHVSEYNMNAMLYELLNEKKYVEPEATNQPEGPKLTEITEEDENEDEETTDTTDNCSQSQKKPIDQTFVSLEGVRIHFLPLQSIPDLHKKSKYQKLFDIVYFSNSMVHNLAKDVTPVFAEKASIITETAKYMIELKQEQTKQYVSKVISLAKGAGCKPVEPIDDEDDNFLYFTYENSS